VGLGEDGQGSTPLRASARKSVGMPISVPVGIGRTLPRTQTPASPTAGEMSSSPTDSASSTAYGTRRSMLSAPSSTGTPPTSETRTLPPTRSEPSRTTTSTPARRSSSAAASPATPAPTTATLGTP
jgi:hypothetical protein